MQSIPPEMEGSVALQFVISRGWEWKVATSPNIELETCPQCQKSGYGHAYMEIHGPTDEQKNRDGLWACHRCGKGGNLYSLKQHLGIVTTQGMESRKDWTGQKEIEPLPDMNAAHQALLEDENAMDYLMNGRGFSRDIITRMRIGIVPKRYFRETGEVKALVYPYLVNGNVVFVHYRTLPTMPLSENKVPKAFSSPKGWDVPLYNQEVLRPGIKDVIFVEGEPNCIAAMDHGIENICGVPGANVKKAEWIDVLDKLELERIYICYDKDKVGQRAAQTLASRIGVERCWKITLPEFEVTTDEGITRSGKDLNEWFVSGGGTAEAFEKLKEEAVQFDVDGVASSKDAVDEFLEELEGKEGLEPKYKTAWPSLNNLVGFDSGDVIDVIASEKTGKLQSLDSMILTKSGKWKRNGDLVVGDQLASIDGEPSVVTGIYPQGMKEMFKITFADGRSTKAGAEHLWKVCHINEPDCWRVYTTDSIIGEYKRNQTGHGQKAGNINKELYVPLISGKFGQEELPFDAWMLGVLIGDGCFANGTPRLTTVDQEIAAQFAKLLPAYDLCINAIGQHRERWKNGHIRASRLTVKEFGISRLDRSGDNTNYLKHTLKELGLWGKTSESKFIPKVYLEASFDNRLKLLQGLMDTDGTAGNKYGSISYCTISRQLAEDVVYLVRSLGGMAKSGKPTKKSFHYKGQLRQGQDAFIINIRLPIREKVFTLERKLKRVKPRLHQPRLTITHIESCGLEDSQCIAVSHPSKLYITDDFIVTHNTTFAMNLIEHMVDSYGEDGVVICLEMTRAKLARKWLSHLAGIEDNIPKTPEEAIALKHSFLSAIPAVKEKAATREGDLYFCYPRYKTDDDLYRLMIEIIRRYGVKWIVIDNLQRWADTTPYGKGGQGSRTEHLSSISKVTSQIAKDYNIQMVRILQPHRVAEGKIVTSDNTDGSSQIAKDCDCNISLYREKANQVSKEMLETLVHVESDTSMSPNMLVTVGLSRYSSGGYTTLLYDGARSTVKERDEIEKVKVQTAISSKVGYEGVCKSLNIALDSEAVKASDVSAKEGGVYEGAIEV